VFDAGNPPFLSAHIGRSLACVMIFFGVYLGYRLIEHSKTQETDVLSASPSWILVTAIILFFMGLSAGPIQLSLIILAFMFVGYFFSIGVRLADTPFKGGGLITLGIGAPVGILFVYCAHLYSAWGGIVLFSMSLALSYIIATSVLVASRKVFERSDGEFSTIREIVRHFIAPYPLFFAAFIGGGIGLGFLGQPTAKGMIEYTLGFRDIFTETINIHNTSYSLFSFVSVDWLLIWVKNRVFFLTMFGLPIFLLIVSGLTLLINFDKKNMKGGGYLVLVFAMIGALFSMSFFLINFVNIDPNADGAELNIWVRTRLLEGSYYGSIVGFFILAATIVKRKGVINLIAVLALSWASVPWLMALFYHPLGLTEQFMRNLKATSKIFLGL